jgi:ABC-type multidrug transport system ATPase subunit
MTETIVSTHRLTKTFGPRRAVDAVDRTVRRGEVYGFLGPNGAGKTTTLRMLVGLVRPTSGRALVHGLAPGDPAAIARTGSLVESPGFYPYLSGRENLRVLARYRGLPDREVDRVLDRVDLAARGGDRFRAYSLGMKQRLGVAAALLGDPDLLVLDEPTNGLDPAGMADMRRLLIDVAAGGQTVLLSSHLLAEVQEICDRVGIIDGGRLLVESTVAELRGSSGILLRARPLDRALAVAMRLAGDDAVEVITEPPADPAAGRGLRLAAPPELVPELARRLVTAGVDITELRHVERSLEEVFFDLTRTLPALAIGQADQVHQADPTDQARRADQADQADPTEVPA